MTGSTSGSASAPAPLTGPAAPCWVNLMTRDLESAQEFYGPVMGWTFRPGKLGQEFSVARRGDVPVAGIGAVATTFSVAVAWTPYFSVQDADAAAARIRERSGTVAVGPLALGKGRGALAADRDGAGFGIWERTAPATSPPLPTAMRTPGCGCARATPSTPRSSTARCWTGPADGQAPARWSTRRTR